MVRGLSLFRESFASYRDCYVLIGGTAATIAMEGAGLEFRATKDLDIVLNIETFDAKVARALWLFVDEGGYSHRQKSTAKPLFYRFDDPKNEHYPEMIELFSRVPEALHIDESRHLTPIPVGQDVPSLSAILLDPDYYEFIHTGKKLINELPTVGPDRLIPLKARAWLDMTERRAAGANIDEREIRKHRNDVIRLYRVLDPASPITMPGAIAADLNRFLSFLREDPGLNLPALGVRNTPLETVIDELSSIFRLR